MTSSQVALRRNPLRRTWKSPPRDWRDEKLWNLLPAIDAPYEYHSLSVAEMEALAETLSDGFGEPWVQGGEPLSLPASLKSGLLEHAFHRSRNFKYYDADAWDDEFWSSDDDGPSPSETFPLGFTPRRLRVYFQNQFNRFCNGRGRDDYSIDSEWIGQEMAASRLYQKPWYEFHALLFLDFIDFSSSEMSVAASQFAGQLGRLVEQYYWRFRFEKAAMTGVGAKKAPVPAGKLRPERTNPSIPSGRMRRQKFGRTGQG